MADTVSQLWKGADYGWNVVVQKLDGPSKKNNDAASSQLQ